MGQNNNSNGNHSNGNNGAKRRSFEWKPLRSVGADLERGCRVLIQLNDNSMRAVAKVSDKPNSKGFHVVETIGDVLDGMKPDENGKLVPKARRFNVGGSVKVQVFEPKVVLPNTNVIEEILDEDEETAPTGQDNDEADDDLPFVPATLVSKPAQAG